MDPLARRDRAATAWWLLRMAFYTAVLGQLFFLAFLQPYDTQRLRLFAGASAVVLGVVAALLSRVRGTRAWQRVDVALFNLCAALLLLELGLRGIAALSPSPLLVRSNARVVERIAAHRLAAGSDWFGTPLDARGYHDTPGLPANAKLTVAAVGDSFNVGVVPHAWHYTTVAERRLPGLRIDNIGVPGIGPPEYLHLIATEVLPAAPDRVLLCLFVGNDIAENGRFRASLARAWYDRENVLLALLPRRLLALRREQLSRITHAPQLPAVDLERRYPWLRDPALEPPTFTREAFAGIEASRVYQAFRADDDALYRALFEVLERIVARVRPERLRVLLIPTEVQVEPALWREVLEATPYDFPVDLERPQREVGAWLAARGVAVLDPLPAMRAVAPLADGRRHLFHLRDTHLNARGNAVLGEALAGFLAPEMDASARARPSGGGGDVPDG